MLGDRRQKVRSRKNLEVAVDLRIQFRAVEDLLAFGVERHFGNRKRVARNILGELFEDGLVFWWNAFALMHVEAAVFPARDLRFVISHCLEAVHFRLLASTKTLKAPVFKGHMFALASVPLNLRLPRIQRLGI